MFFIQPESSWFVEREDESSFEPILFVPEALSVLRRPDMIFAFHFSFAAPLLVERRWQIVENHRPKSFVALALKGVPKSPLKCATRLRFKLRCKTRPSMPCLSITALPAHRVYERMQKRMSIISGRRRLLKKATK